jgi:hypothetical protein
VPNPAAEATLATGLSAVVRIFRVFAPEPGLCSTVNLPRVSHAREWEKPSEGPNPEGFSLWNAKLREMSSKGELGCADRGILSYLLTATASGARLAPIFVIRHSIQWGAGPLGEMRF